jgi:restriction system protein
MHWIIAFFVIVVIFHDVSKGLGIFALIVYATIVIAIYFYNKAKSKQIELDNLIQQRIDAIIDKHSDALARQYISLVRKDAYGVEIVNSWHKEIGDFLDRVVAPEIGVPVSFKKGRKMHYSALILNQVDQSARAKANNILLMINFDDRTTPLEYEIYCASMLRKNGWEASTTKGSSDQGGDVVASHGKTRIVVQCKLYSKPVGNKAIQEAHAAKAHYGADYAAVVTNAGYTEQARQLANTTGVYLLHHADLPVLRV